MTIIPHASEQFEELWDGLDICWGIGPPTTERIRETHKGPWPTEDDVTRYLTKKGLVLGVGADGMVHVTCPWAAEHTTPNTVTGTSYFAGRGFKCLHSHCASRTVHEFLNAIGHTIDGFERIDPSTDGVAPVVPSQRAAYQLLTADDLAARPPLSWCVKGVLPNTGLAALYGPSGSGKSFVAIDLAMALSSDSPWFGLRTKARPVTYCALEGEGGIAQRVAAYRARHGKVGEQVRYLLQPVNLLQPADVAALAQAIIDAGGAGGVTILDTLNRAAPGSDENDSRDMGLIIAAAKSLQEQVGGLVLVVHHTGKDITKGLRGHSSLLAALDCAIEVTRAGDRRSWCIAKSKDGLDGNAHPFRLEVVELGPDEDLDPVSSCVIVPETVTAGEVQKMKIPGGGNQKIVWQAIRELLKTEALFDTEKWPKSVPAGRSCIELEDAVVKARDRLTCAPDQRTRSTRTAITALVNAGHFNLKEGWLWEP